MGVLVTGKVGADVILVGKIHSEQDLDFVTIHRHLMEARHAMETAYRFRNVLTNLAQV